jgi:hypothetical protein
VLLAAVAIGGLAFAAAPSAATPLATGLIGINAAAPTTSGLVEQAHYKRYRHYSYYRHRHHRRHHYYFARRYYYPRYYGYSSYYCDGYYDDYYGDCGYPYRSYGYPFVPFIGYGFSFGGHHHGHHHHW